MSAPTKPGIFIKYADAPGRKPASGELGNGEIAINEFDGLLFTRNADGSIRTTDLAGLGGGSSDESLKQELSNTGLIGGMTVRRFNSFTNSDDSVVTELTRGSRWGTIIEAVKNAHLVFGLRPNDSGDALFLLETDLGTNETEYKRVVIKLNSNHFQYNGHEVFHRGNLDAYTKAEIDSLLNSGGRQRFYSDPLPIQNNGEISWLHLQSSIPKNCGAYYTTTEAVNGFSAGDIVPVPLGAYTDSMGVHGRRYTIELCSYGLNNNWITNHAGTGRLNVNGRPGWKVVLWGEW